MIALTVWLPGHLVINYLDFFATSKGAADAAARSFRVAILLEGVFGPLVVAATLAAGRRRGIFWTGGFLFAAVFSMAAALSALAGLAEHFVVQVLADCLIAVTQTVFTIAMFLFYWEARQAPVPSPAPATSPGQE